MQIFIKDLDYELQEIISKGNFVLAKKEGDKLFSSLDQNALMKKLKAKNYRVLNILFCDMDSNEFKCV